MSEAQKGAAVALTIIAVLAVMLAAMLIGWL
jgi:hypothetical protein